MPQWSVTTSRPGSADTTTPAASSRPETMPRPRPPPSASGTAAWVKIVGIPALSQLELERAHHPDALDRRAGRAERSRLVAAVEAEDLDRALIGRPDAADLGPGVRRELLRGGARVLRRVGQQLRAQVVERRDHVARVGPAVLALAVEDHAGLEQLFGGAHRCPHQLHVCGAHHHRGRHHVAEPIARLRLAVLAGELVHRAGRLALDLGLGESLLPKERHHRVPVRGEAGVGVRERLAGPPQAQRPHGAVSIHLALHQPLHGDDAGVRAEAHGATAHQVSRGGEPEQEAEPPDQRGEHPRAAVIRYRHVPHLRGPLYARRLFAGTLVPRVISKVITPSTSPQNADPIPASVTPEAVVRNVTSAASRRFSSRTAVASALPTVASSASPAMPATSSAGNAARRDTTVEPKSPITT